MDERVENPELKEIMKTRPEEMTEEQLEAFVDAFMEATFIIPAELNSDVEALEGKTEKKRISTFTDWSFPLKTLQCYSLKPKKGSLMVL